MDAVVTLGRRGAAAPGLAVRPPAARLGTVVLAAVLSFASMMLISWAYARGEASYLATTEYTSFVYAAALGWLVFGESVSPLTVLGAAIIVAACLWGARRQDVAATTLEPAA